MEKRNSIFYEFYRQGEYISTHFETLENTIIETGIDTVPTLTMTIPLKNLPSENMALFDVIVHIQKDGEEKYIFHGIVDSMDLNYAKYSVTLSLSHYVARMRDWLMPCNYTVKDYSITDLIGVTGAALGYPNTLADPQAYNSPKIDFEIADPDDTKVSMTFSSDNKLEALTEILNNTEKLHFRVDLNERTKITIGTFGTLQNVKISPDPIPNDGCEPETIKTMDKTFVTMLTEPNCTVDYTNHFNRAVVFCGDIGEGIMHLTLKALYDRPNLQIDGFPIGMYEYQINQQPETEYEETSTGSYTKVNNEKIYKNHEAISYANNDNREYYVTDIEQLNKDGMVVRHSVYNFSDMYPIPKTTDTDEDGETIEYVITDDDRLEMTKQAYWRAIRKLKSQRPDNAYQFNCTALPKEVLDGDKVSFRYLKKVIIPKEYTDEDCGDTVEQVVGPLDAISDKDKAIKELYVTKRTITFDETLSEICTLTLDEELRTKDTTASEIELREAASSDSTSDWKNVYDQGEVGLNNYSDMDAVWGSISPSSSAD